MYPSTTILPNIFSHLQDLKPSLEIYYVMFNKYCQLSTIVMNQGLSSPSNIATPYRIIVAILCTRCGPARTRLVEARDNPITTCIHVRLRT